MKYIFPILFIALSSFTEAPISGIFIVKKPTKKDPCERELKMLIGSKRVCILKNPIVNINELEYVTDILYDPIVKCNHVNVGLSSSSIKTLNETINYIKGAEFALVVNNDVIGIFKIEEKLTTRYLRIGTDLDIESLFLVHDALKKVQF